VLCLASGDDWPSLGLRKVFGKKIIFEFKIFRLEEALAGIFASGRYTLVG
jgi:hypothetical protein